MTSSPESVPATQISLSNVGSFSRLAPAFSAADASGCFVASATVLARVQCQTGRVTRQLQFPSAIAAFCVSERLAVVGLSSGGLLATPVEKFSDPGFSFSPAEEVGLPQVQHAETVFCKLSFSPDGHVLFALTADGDLLELSTKKADKFGVKRRWKNAVRTTKTSSDDIFLAVSPGFVAFVDGRSSPTVVCLVERKRQQQQTPVRKFRHARPITTLTLDPADRHLVIGDAKGMLYACHGVLSHTKKLNTELSAEAKVAKKAAKKDGDPSSHSSSLLALGAALKHWHAHPVGSVTCVGGLIASGGAESVMVLWNLDLDSTQFFPRLGGGIAHVRGSPDGRFCAVAMLDNSIAFVDMQMANQVKKLRGLNCSEDGTTAMQILPDGKIAMNTRRAALQLVDTVSAGVTAPAFGVDDTLKISDRNENTALGPSKRRQAEEQPWRVTQFHFLANGQWLCTAEERSSSSSTWEKTATEGRVLKWWKRSAEQWELDCAVYDAHAAAVTSLLGHSCDSEPKAKAFFLTTSLDGYLKKWELGSAGSAGTCWQATGMQTWKNDTPLNCASLLEDGSAVAVASDDAVIVWETQNFASPLPHALKHRVLSAKREKIGGTTIVQVHSAVVREELCLFSLGKATLNVWDLGRGKLLQAVGGAGWGKMAWDSGGSGQLAVVGADGVEILSAMDAATSLGWELRVAKRINLPALAAEFLPSGALAVVAAETRALYHCYINDSNATPRIAAETTSTTGPTEATPTVSDFARLFGATKASDADTDRLETFLGDYWGHSLRGEQSKSLEQRKALLKRVIPVAAASHALPAPSHLLSAYLGAQLRTGAREVADAANDDGERDSARRKNVDGMSTAASTPVARLVDDAAVFDAVLA